MKKEIIIILGYGSQLSLCLKKTLPAKYKCITFTRKQLDINNAKKLQKKLENIKPLFVINTAALTDVNYCEINPDQCLNTNAYSLINISKYVKKTNSFLVHFSSDFVYDGNKNQKYKENDITKPISVYGRSKLLSEKFIKKNTDRYIIFRVSSLYSNYKNNFYTKIIDALIKSKELKIYNYQKSNPTNAYDFANDIWSILEFQIKIKPKIGIFNYTSSGKPVSRYEFSKLILKYLKKYKKISSTIKPVNAKNNYKDIRPRYSSLNIDKVTNTFKIKKINNILSIKRAIHEYYLESKHLKL